VAEFSTSTPKVEDVTLQFADGAHAIPGVFVAEMGGADEVRKLADVARSVSYADFMRGLSDERAGRYLDGQVSQMIDAHLRVRT
jgi:hypothetical protein